MVDDGSALNVCPLKLLSRFKIEKAELEPSDALIRAYDNTKRSVEGTFQAKVKVGPVESMVTVTVLDIPATFAVLLRSEEHTSELQSRPHLVCRLLLEKKKACRGRPA